ncbi:P-loop containing nucleoside triphosphate hydrolase protein [Kockovaella imperatae]|uniref:ATP-dependent RNA helicase n=1 Tax=Kockovaella imperatae TaxID=4999 RepID=A0A1Y1UTQ3_9TREE|nr:P-loop containing nucleoside triphosphate hydrolase protein [Kockovaella imperatae]ORX40806.1 P-loop containing nucleoside triphosphate hydrolase protein [Kockovaella imperatae]
MSDQQAAASIAAKGASSKSKKAKSEAQKRYQAKKARKHRVLAKARRDAAPKNKKFDGQSQVYIKDDSGAAQVEAGPSRYADASEALEDVSMTASAKKKGKEKAKGEIGRPGVASTASSSREAGSDDKKPESANGQGAEDEEQERQERKRVKREKRENRDRSARKAKRQKRDEKVQAGVDIGGADLADANDLRGEVGEDYALDQDGDLDLPGGDQESLTGADEEDTSPSTLEAFPLPLAPAAADPVLLTKQGLPKGLENAQLIDAGLSASLDEVPSAIHERLKAIGIERLFAIQAAILPKLLSLPLVPTPYTRLCDYLASAPTGSGKTLAYVLPIVHILSTRVVPQLRALIVLPTRDLVVQVRETLEILTKESGLIIGSITGQHSFGHEQGMLGQHQAKLDILVATPGRLIDHLNGTPGFTLQHLRFLVIDEADRLLGQSYHDWLVQVLGNTSPYCQKLLFSATLTRDPAAIASLKLHNPQYLIVQSIKSNDTNTFSLPDTLSERYIVTLATLKPLVLIHLLHQCGSGGLVFCKSVDSVTRLVHLLTAYGQKSVQGYTSDMKTAERKALLADFSSGKVDFLICSDLVARGMDLPVVSHVISYDVPMDMRKYVHRVGRTARAERSGNAFTLVEKQEALYFKAMLREAGRDKVVKRIRLQEGDLDAYNETYEAAMSKVKALYGAAE